MAGYEYRSNASVNSDSGRVLGAITCGHMQHDWTDWQDHWRRVWIGDALVCAIRGVLFLCQKASLVFGDSVEIPLSLKVLGKRVIWNRKVYLLIWSWALVIKHVSTCNAEKGRTGMCMNTYAPSGIPICYACMRACFEGLVDGPQHDEQTHLVITIFHQVSFTCKLKEKVWWGNPRSE